MTMKRKQILVLLAAAGFLCQTRLSAQYCGSNAVLMEPLSHAKVSELTLPVFGGYMITPGPLYYNGSSFAVHSDWKYNSYESAHGRRPGSTFFNFLDLGMYFDSARDGFSIEYQFIDNCGGRVFYGPFRDWRLPTDRDWAVILGTGRQGAVVSGERHVCHITVIVTGIRYAGMKDPLGLLLFPDGLEMEGRHLMMVNKHPVTYEMTPEDLDYYLDKGCVFLPASGQYFVDRLYWFFGGINGLYHSSESLSEHQGAAMQFGTRVPGMAGADKVFHLSQARLVRKVTLKEIPGGKRVTATQGQPAGLRRSPGR